MFIKQLLDEVFVICRIINVEVRVISRAEGEANNSYWDIDITICKQPFGANFFTRCLAPKTCTFGRQNMHVWQAKHVRLAGETCTFGRRNMHS